MRIRDILIAIVELVTMAGCMYALAFLWSLSP